MLVARPMGLPITVREPAKRASCPSRSRINAERQGPDAQGQGPEEGVVEQCEKVCERVCERVGWYILIASGWMGVGVAATCADA